jgi:hypothetical protein
VARNERYLHQAALSPFVELEAVKELHARRRQETRNAFPIETAPCQLRNVYEESTPNATKAG